MFVAIFTKAQHCRLYEIEPSVETTCIGVFTNKTDAIKALQAYIIENTSYIYRKTKFKEDIDTEHKLREFCEKYTWGYENSDVDEEWNWTISEQELR